MNWNNVNLKTHERESTILDSYSFETLLLEISCNLRDINRDTVRAQFLESLNSKITTAKEIFEANLDNIVKTANFERHE